MPCKLISVALHVAVPTSVYTAQLNGTIINSSQALVGALFSYGSRCCCRNDIKRSKLTAPDPHCQA